MNRLKLKILLSCTCLLLLTACKREHYYYEAIGEGYVYIKDTKEPAPYAYIEVRNQPWETTGYESHPTCETFIADANGYFKVRFIKKYNWTSHIYRYSYVWAWNKEFSSADNEIRFEQEFLKKQKKTFKIDTLWIKKPY